jgi:hypothetical protein
MAQVPMINSTVTFQPFLCALAKVRKATVDFVMTDRLFVLPSLWNNLAPTEGIFMKFDI